jgi:DNA polymerase
MDKKSRLEQIENNVKICTKCRLFQIATNPVPGEGNPDSELVFIGEAPGFYEDQSGSPFVGRAGKLLEKALEKIGYTREQVWIGNIIKHRPPVNRDPLEDEIIACSPYLTLQLKIIEPVLVVTLGRFAMNYFYPEGKITRDRGQVMITDKYKVFPVYHPAAALRGNEMMRNFMMDFVKIPKILEEIKIGKYERKLPEKNIRDIPDGQLKFEL